MRKPGDERSRAKAELELAKAQEISRRHEAHQRENSRKYHMKNVIFFRLLRERFGGRCHQSPSPMKPLHWLRRTREGA